MSTQFELNEAEILHRFHEYLEELNNAQAATEALLDDCRDPDMNVASCLYVLENIIVPEIMLSFAERFLELDNCYDYDPSEDSLNSILEIFCAKEKLDSDLQNTLATAINEAAAQDEDDEDEDDNDVVFKPGTQRPYKQPEWTELSDEEKQAKVKRFLKRLATAHLDMRDMKPFVKTLDVGNQENPYGVKVGQKVKVFDRKANRYGHKNELGNWIGPNEGSILFPNSSGQGHDEDHKNHPLHSVAGKHGFAYSHSTPVNQNDGSILHHHTWRNNGGHVIGAYHDDFNWSSKVSSANFYNKIVIYDAKIH